MPQFILGNSFRESADKYPLVREAIWLFEASAFRLLFLLLTLLPVEQASRLGQKVAIKLGPKLKKNKTFRRNIERAFPEKTAEEQQVIVRNIWGNCGAILGEFPHLRRICYGEKHPRLNITACDEVMALQAAGKPLIIVCAHLSNWEVIGAALSKLGIPCAVPYTPIGNQRLNRIIAKYREALGLTLFPKQESMRPMMRHIANGRSLAFVMDQRVDNGQAADFFGMPKMTSVVPAKLALRYDTHVIPVRVQRLGNARYRVNFYPPVLPDTSNATEQEKILQITTLINQHFEQWIREQPGEWFPSKRRWDKM